MAEEGAGLEGLDDADSPEDEGVVEPRRQAGKRIRLRRGGLLQQPPRRFQRLVLPAGVVGAGGHPARRISAFVSPWVAAA